jgi:hypothetical protein
MRKNRNGRRARLLPRVLLLLWASATPVCAGAVAEWNAWANALAVEQRAPPATHARNLALLHAAVFAAVDAAGRADSSPEAAAAAAAHDILVALYPDRAADLSPALARSLARIANDVPKARGYAMGKKAAAAVLRGLVPRAGSEGCPGQAR